MLGGLPTTVPFAFGRAPRVTTSCAFVGMCLVSGEVFPELAERQLWERTGSPGRFPTAEACQLLPLTVPALAVEGDRLGEEW